MRARVARRAPARRFTLPMRRSVWMRVLLATVLVATLLPITGAPAFADVPMTYWVDVATGSDANTGLSEADAFKTITKACDKAGPVDTIMVKPGTYSVASGESFPLYLQGASLMSTGGRDVTILQGNGLTILHAVYGQPGDSISGFTFKGTRSTTGPPVGVPAVGAALRVDLNWLDGPSGLRIDQNLFDDHHSGGADGGGIEVVTTGGPGPFSILVEGNTFNWNTTGTTGRGGGLFVGGPIATIVFANLFIENSADYGGGIALLTDDVTVHIAGNHIAANEAHIDGGGIYLDHAGLEVHQIRDNNIWSNIANEGSGGGIWLRSATAEVKRNDGSNNDAEVGGFGYLTDASVSAENNLIFGGSAASAGAAWYLDGVSELHEVNDTVAANGSATCDEATYAWIDSTLTIVNSIYWNEFVPAEIVNADSVSHSCVRGAGISGPGVIHTDPQFRDPDSRDARLTLGSPCIDTASSLGAPDIDYFWTARPKDGNSDGVAKYDMGFHEFVPAPTLRLSDRTRFSTAIEIARKTFPRWEGVKDVVIASGDDRAAADPLAASGLCWAYDAPLLLVSGTRTPDEVKATVKQIVDVNGPVTLRVVGGPLSVPDARLNEIRTYVGAANVATIDRIVSRGGRYDLAAAIAYRMRSVAAARPDKTMPKTALFANGADSTKFFDALALSPIAAGTGAPILLVTADTVPSATAAAVTALSPTTRIVGGGPNTISEKVRMQLGATRWAGRTRYDTAIAIANGAVAKGWLSRSSVGIAARLPDALTGGGLVGREGGVLLLTDGVMLSPATKSWLTTYKKQIEKVYVFGGPLSISESVRTEIANAIK